MVTNDVSIATFVVVPYNFLQSATGFFLLLIFGLQESFGNTVPVYCMLYGTGSHSSITGTGNCFFITFLLFDMYF